MRRLSDAETLAALMRRLGEQAREPARVYFTGGATAVLLGWRSSTVDVDVLIDPGGSSLFEAIPRLKEELSVNVELACPGDFIPELPGWRERCLFIERRGRADFYHYDLYAQALAKIERAHALDLDDVRAMIDRGLVEPRRAVRLFEQIEPLLYRFPAIDPKRFRRRALELLGG